MKGRQLKRWRSWEDYIRAWCGRADFRAVLPHLVGGADPEFAAYLAASPEEAAVSGTHSAPGPVGS